MSKKDGQNLNENEKNEIKNDVKDAFKKAFSKPTNSIKEILNSGPRETLNQEEVDKIVNKNNKHSDKKPLILTLVLIVLIAIAGVYVYFSNNPKTIFIRAIDKTFNMVEKNTNFKYEKTKGKLTLDLNGNINNQNISNLTVNMDYGIDTKEKLLNADIALSSDKQNILNAKIYNENEKTYLYIEKILNKYLEFDVALINNDERKTMLKSLNKAITKALENNKFSGSTMQIEINGKITKTYKSSLMLNQDDIKNILNNINENLKNNKKFIEALSKTTNKTKEEANNKLTNKINQIKNDLANTKSLIFDIYTQGATQKFVKLEISEVVNNNTNKLSIINVSNNKYQYIIDDKENQQKINGNIEYKNENNNLYLKLEMKQNLKNQASTNLNLTLKNKYQKTNEIELIDINEVVKISELSEEEKLNLFTKVLFTS